MSLTVKFFAQVPHGAFSALGITGGTEIPSEQDDAMAEIRAFLRWKNGSQLALHLFRLLAVTQTHPAADADAVSVTDHTSRNGIQIA